MRFLLWLAVLLFIAWIVFWAVAQVIGAAFWTLLALACFFYILHLFTRPRTPVAGRV